MKIKGKTTEQICQLAGYEAEIDISPEELAGQLSQREKIDLYSLLKDMSCASEDKSEKCECNCGGIHTYGKSCEVRNGSLICKTCGGEVITKQDKKDCGEKARIEELELNPSFEDNFSRAMGNQMVKFKNKINEIIRRLNAKRGL
jgi:hypothetical protein